MAERDLTDLQEKVTTCKNITVLAFVEDILKMETGLPTKEVFHIFPNYTHTLKQLIFAGWKVESISFEYQIFNTLMKVRQG